MTSVLVIDDSSELRNMLRRLLASLGYEVREAESGAQGLKSYQVAPADIVLLDMFMPAKNGLDTLRDLLHCNPDARVIAMTGGGEAKDVSILRSALLLGARKLLYKPVTPEELQAAIDETMSETR